MLGAAKRLGLPVIVARATPDAVDVVSFPRRAPAPDASLDVPPQAADASAPGAADVRRRDAGRSRGAASGSRASTATSARIRHLRLPLDGGEPLAQELGAS